MTETKDPSDQDLRGGQPNKLPIRKKGFYRALKRGEVWALLEKARKEMIINIWKEMFKVEDK